jgi:hypothetical protein
MNFSHMPRAWFDDPSLPAQAQNGIILSIDGLIDTNNDPIAAFHLNITYAQLLAYSANMTERMFLDMLTERIVSEMMTDGLLALSLYTGSVAANIFSATRVFVPRDNTGFTGQDFGTPAGDWPNTFHYPGMFLQKEGPVASLHTGTASINTSLALTNKLVFHFMPCITSGATTRRFMDETSVPDIRIIVPYPTLAKKMGFTDAQVTEMIDGDFITLSSEIIEDVLSNAGDVDHDAACLLRFYIPNGGDFHLAPHSILLHSTLATLSTKSNSHMLCVSSSWNSTLMDYVPASVATGSEDNTLFKKLDVAQAIQDGHRYASFYDDWNNGHFTPTDGRQLSEFEVWFAYVDKSLSGNYITIDFNDVPFTATFAFKPHYPQPSGNVMY